MPFPKRLIAIGDESLTLDEWAARSGVPASTIRTRIDKLGWPAEQAVNTPADRRFKKGGRPRADAPRACPPLRELTDGRAGVQWRHGGRTHSRSFGRWGSQEAKAAYARFAAAWAAGGPGGTVPVTAAGVSVADLLGRWLDHCETEYVKRGKVTSEVHCCRAAARELNTLYGDTPAKDFGPPELKLVRRAMLRHGWVRNTINNHTRRLARCFKWGVAERLVPVDVYQALLTLGGLKKGRGVPDRPRKQAAPDADVAAVLAWAGGAGKARPAVLAALVEVQRLVGCRPGELCALTVDQIDRTVTDAVWPWVIPADKNEHLGRGPKEAFFGPKSQAILLPLLADAGDGPVFRWPAVRLGRRTPVTVGAYREGLAEACAATEVPVFTPHQLRHSLATEVARRYQSLDAAAAAIGDSPATAAATYVHVDPLRKLKIDIAREMG